MQNLKFPRPKRLVGSGSIAVAVLRKQIGLHQANVCSASGLKPVHQVNTNAWHKALVRVGIENFRWHDLRHNWASWHIQEGTPLHVLQELGGWSSPEMVQKYAHLSRGHLAQWVDRRPAELPETVPEIDTFFTTGKEKGARLLA